MMQGTQMAPSRELAPERHAVRSGAAVNTAAVDGLGSVVAREHDNGVAGNARLVECISHAPGIGIDLGQRILTLRSAGFDELRSRQRWTVRQGKTAHRGKRAS